VNVIQAPPTEVQIERVTARAFVVPTDRPERDGTLAWDDTTLVLVQVEAEGVAGIGYAYGERVAADIVRSKLAEVVVGQSAMSIAAPWWSMRRAVRNAGLPGVCATAVSAVDVALWDLKARLLGLSLASLLGPARERVPVYGSGGFTSYTHEQLVQQFSAWASDGVRALKMKVGTDPQHDGERVAAARSAIGPAAELFVDANGAYDRKQAMLMAERFAEVGVTWFEEPVSSDDLEGLRLIRDRAPAGMRIAAGEYGHDGWYFRRMLEAGAVDVLQADATRCLGISGFLQAAALADAHGLPISAHTAPALHMHACCAVGRMAPLEWFHDHVRIESTLFEGAPALVEGTIVPDHSRHGLGLELRAEEAERYAA
jgi:L-alanine-DL-glutamate epimerase-like enolase superfamily enzyme